jgi:hypothetical protein
MVLDRQAGMAVRHHAAIDAAGLTGVLGAGQLARVGIAMRRTVRLLDPISMHLGMMLEGAHANRKPCQRDGQCKQCANHQLCCPAAKLQQTTSLACVRIGTLIEPNNSLKYGGFEGDDSSVGVD